MHEPINAPDYDVGIGPEKFEGMLDHLQKSFSKPESVKLGAPSMVNDKEFTNW